MAWRIEVDIGGTFTDVAVVDDASSLIACRPQFDRQRQAARFRVLL
jgi:N-methylhydantoinase A/oxoprolinase/acetone carboxylase beta subunit